MAEWRGWNPFSAIQIEWNLLQRTVEHDLVPMADALGLAIAAFSPLAGGVLTAKHQQTGADSGRTEWVSSRAGQDRTKTIVPEVLAIAGEIGRSPAQVAVNWVRQQSASVFPILGARKPGQLTDVLGALDVELSADHMARLREVSDIPGGFVAGMWANRMLVDTFITGGTIDRIDGIRRYL